MVIVQFRLMPIGLEGDFVALFVMQFLLQINHPQLAYQ